MKMELYFEFFYIRIFDRFGGEQCFFFRVVEINVGWCAGHGHATDERAKFGCLAGKSLLNFLDADQIAGLHADLKLFVDEFGWQIIERADFGELLDVGFYSAR